MKETLYAKIVHLKKRLFKRQWLPDAIGRPIDEFFNQSHNTLIKTRDLTRDYLVITKDTVRDSLTITKDITRDSFLKTKDITHDSLIAVRDSLTRTKDITINSLLKTKNVAHNSLITARDITHGSLITTKDHIRDSLEKTADTTRDSLKRNKDIGKEVIKDSSILTETSLEEVNEQNNSLRFFFYPLFICYALYNIFYVFFYSIALRKYTITQASDKEAVKHITRIVTNSKNVAKRVKACYHRDLVVVHPPVESDVFKFNSHQEYWLSVNRLTPEKRIEFQIKAFALLPNEKLLIVGGYDDYHARYATSLQRESSKNIIFLGQVDERDLINLYANCKGLIATSKDEDFGMNAVEAMAAGKPVIAPHEGGYRETVVDGITGVLVQDMDEEKIVRAMEVISNNLNKDPLFYRDRCQQQARNFDVEVFAEKICNLIEV